MKQCFYDVLGVERSCTLDQLRSAYRKLALKNHPDKAPVEERKEATEKFQIILEAYETLKDPHERAWYDAHRDQILRGEEDVDGQPQASKVSVWSLFRRGAFKEFDNSSNGFYAVYREAFETLASEEADASDGDPVIYMSFGDSNTQWKDVSQFYRQWCDFVSVKSFAEQDKYRPQDAPNRQIRRVMEQENKKLRSTARKDFMTAVRRLAERCKKWDPRVEQHQKEEATKAKEAAAEKAERMEREKAEKAAAREKARAEEAARWAEEAARRAEEEDDEEESEEEEKVEELYYCPIFKKTFKTQGAYENHCRSKKYLKEVERIKREMEEEDDDEDEDDEPAVVAPSKPAAKAEDLIDLQAKGGGVDLGALIDALPDGTKKKPVAAKPVDVPIEDSDDDEDESDSDDGLARLARDRAARNFAPPPREAAEEEEPPAEAPAGAPEGADAEEKEADEEAEEAQAGKKARKPRRRAKEAGAAPAEPAADAKECRFVDADPATTCRTCGSSFDSRSKLFAHIEKTGHGVIKVMAPPNGKQGKTKKR